ncbi:putative nucleotidyltransferase, ribonuclease H [Tanacetum coccineum]
MLTIKDEITQMVPEVDPDYKVGPKCLLSKSQRSKADKGLKGSNFCSWDEYLCLVEFAYNNSWHASIKAAPFELLYGRKCRAPICWDEVGERLIEGPELIEITNEKVAVAKEKLKEARSRQKSYANKHRRDLEFQVGDRVFPKVSPFRGVKRFRIKGKLSPRVIGPFEILERIGEVSYRLALPLQLSHVHDVFHVSLLRGYHYHPLHVASYPFDQIQPDMSLSEEPESILDRQERVMRNKVIPFVKILWKNHPEREATWETEESMRASYPHFFVRIFLIPTPLTIIMIYALLRSFRYWYRYSDLIVKAFAITPVNPTHPFELPPTGDTVLDFVNELGYPEPVEFVSSIRTNYVYEPWRAILSLLNQCLTGKTSGSDKPRHPVLQMLWGIVTQTNVDHAELIWEEFTQGIQTFFSQKPSTIALSEEPKEESNSSHPLWTIFQSDNLLLGKKISRLYLKVETRLKSFDRQSPDPLITEAIQQSSYYPKYLKMVAANTKKTPQGSASMQPATKRATPKKPTTTTLGQHNPSQLFSNKKLPSLSLETHQEKGKGEGDDADLELAIKLSLDPALLPQRQAPVGGVTIRDPVSETTPKLHEVVGKGERPLYLKTKKSTPPVIAPFTEVSSSKPSSLVTPPPINTEATTITTSLPEITPFIALQLRVARLEQEMSEVKKTDHSADVLATIRTQVPTAVDNYLGTLLDVLPQSVKNQESEKSPKEIIKAKKEKDEEKQDSTYSIRSTDKVDLEEFDLKSALFSYMNQKKTRVKDHKRKHDSDDDDDEGPSAGSNQGRSTKRRKSDSAASGWQITDTRDADADYSMHRSNPESEHPEQSSGDLSKQDKGNVSDMEDTDNAHIPKRGSTTTCLSNSRKRYTDPLQTYPCNSPHTPNDFLHPSPPQGPHLPYSTTFTVPAENPSSPPADMDECHKLLTNKVDMNNPEGHQILRNIYEHALRRTTRFRDKVQSYTKRLNISESMIKDSGREYSGSLCPTMAAIGKFSWF